MPDTLTRFEREYIQYHRISAGRAKAQMKLLGEFHATLDGRELEQATGQDLQAFAGAALDTGLHVNTVRKYLHMLRPFYSWAYAAGVITAEQFLSIKSVKDPRGSTTLSLPRPYTRKELDEFWTALDRAYPLLPATGKGSWAIRRWLTGKGKWRPVRRHAMRLQTEAAVRLALDCGLRRHEIFGLTLADLHYDNEYLVVHGKADPHTGEKKVRSVPMTEACRAAVKAWVEFRTLMRPSHDIPWISCYTGVETKPMWETRFNGLLHESVGDGWTWHRFRHTCATNWLRANAELETVSKLLGHSSLQQTLGYAAILKSDIAKKLGQVEGDFAELVSNRAA